MTVEKKLADVVTERLATDARMKDTSIFSPEVVEALRLSELYAIGKPKEYVLPLNAMAGFRAHKQI